MLPEISKVELSPRPIEVAGPIAVEVEAQHADGVYMRVDDGPPVLLAPVQLGRFVGEVPVVSSLANGTHAVDFTPVRGDLGGKSVEETFQVALPEAGSESLWQPGVDVGDAVGAGIVVGPDGNFYEFGTLAPAGMARCFLRRRGPNGEFSADDKLAPLLPDTWCSAIDVAITPEGRLYMLAEVEQNGIKRWWLGSLESWESPIEHLRWGLPEKKAHGLALDPDGKAAVCGEVPTGLGDTDAFVEVYDPKGGGLSRAFDFVYEPNDLKHQFSEVARDCAFVDGVIVLAGEAVGAHKDELPLVMDHSRHMVLEFDPATDDMVWNIAAKGPGLLVQSGANAIAVDDDGGYVTAGYVCEDICQPQLKLWWFLAGAEYADAHVPPVKTTAASDIAWSPAGYAVVAAAAPKGGWWSDAWVHAWIPGEDNGLWTYSRSDEETMHWALAVAIGKYGTVYVGGMVIQAGLYLPLVIILHP